MKPSRTILPRLLALATCAAAAACAPAASFPLPMTATDLVRYGTGDALVAYLGQPDASAAVCDLEAKGPHLMPLNEQSVHDFVAAFQRGLLAPESFRRCSDHLLRTPAAGMLLDRMGVAFRDILKSSDLEKDPQLERRLEALHELYLERPHGTDPDPERLREWSVELEQAVGEHRLGPVATRHGGELLTTLSIERGRWKGAQVTEQTLDDLQTKQNEELLRRFAARLPIAEMRREALRRVIRLHISASAYSDVRGHSREIENVVMKYGKNALSPEDYPPTAARVDGSRFAVDRVLVRQNVGAGVAKILGARGSVMPEISLRGSLFVDMTGVSHPVSVCGPTKDLDPTPCLDAGKVHLGNPLVSLDHDGGLVFADEVRITDLLTLAHFADLAVPVSISGRDLTLLRMGLWFERPPDMPFNQGQALLVDIDARGDRRVIYTVSGQGFSYAAVVERPDVGSFRIESHGLPGAPGMDGAHGIDGQPGAPGISAICPATPGGNGWPGGDGTMGGPGTPGGPGGRGGDILIRVACGSQPCEPIVESIRRTITSAGGPGGPGGRGGDGGRGGKGGPGGTSAECAIKAPDGSTNYTGLTAGLNGPDGRDGPRGPDGPPGQFGPPGQVTVQVVQ